MRGPGSLSPPPFRPPTESRANRPPPFRGFDPSTSEAETLSSPRERRRHMKGDPKIIENLNKALRMELTAINQYFLHARMFRNWGFHRLAAIEYSESIDEMKHADRLIERILFLEGLPNLQDLDKLFIGENAVECIECDLRLEYAAHAFYKEAIAHCEQA